MTRWAAIGIDGGLNGAFVAIDTELTVLSVVDMPIIESKRKGKIKRGKNVGKPTVNISRSFDVRGMHSALTHIVDQVRDKGYHPVIFLEKAQAMPKQGLSSTFMTGRGFGMAEMAVVATGVPYQIVTPNEWAKKMLAGLGGEPKERSVKQASRLFPALSLRKPTGRVLDGRSDAAMIACFGLTQPPISREVIKRSGRTPFKKSR
jgi:crossover junction endodeoxyribonuclease RuvC